MWSIVEVVFLTNGDEYFLEYLPALDFSVLAAGKFRISATLEFSQAAYRKRYDAMYGSTAGWLIQVPGGLFQAPPRCRVVIYCRVVYWCRVVNYGAGCRVVNSRSLGAGWFIRQLNHPAVRINHPANELTTRHPIKPPGTRLNHPAPY